MLLELHATEHAQDPQSALCPRATVCALPPRWKDSSATQQDQKRGLHCSILRLTWSTTFSALPLAPSPQTPLISACRIGLRGMRFDERHRRCGTPPSSPGQLESKHIYFVRRTGHRPCVHCSLYCRCACVLSRSSCATAAAVVARGCHANGISYAPKQVIIHLGMGMNVWCRRQRK